MDLRVRSRVGRADPPHRYRRATADAAAPARRRRSPGRCRDGALLLLLAAGYVWLLRYWEKRFRAVPAMASHLASLPRRIAWGAILHDVCSARRAGWSARCARAEFVLLAQMMLWLMLALACVAVVGLGWRAGIGVRQRRRGLDSLCHSHRKTGPLPLAGRVRRLRHRCLRWSRPVVRPTAGGVSGAHLPRPRRIAMAADGSAIVLPAAPRPCAGRVDVVAGDRLCRRRARAASLRK